MNIKELLESLRNGAKAEMIPSYDCAQRKPCRLLNFHMDTRWCHDQDTIIEVSPLALPVEVLDIEENAEKYNVNNLPTIMLVDSDSKEIHRWTGITPSSDINDYLVREGYVYADDVPHSLGEQTQVKDHILRDGSKFTGHVLRYGDNVVPEGMGIRMFSDHNESGHFHSFVLDGVCYLNYHKYMFAGMSRNGSLEGWAMQVKNGVFQFGQYKDDKLVVNLTPLIQPFMSRIHELTRDMNVKIVTVQGLPDSVFVGCPQLIWSGRFGITFRPQGDVYIGQSDPDVGRELTGHYLHLDVDGAITKGYFKDGQMQRPMDDIDPDPENSFISAVRIWSTHEYNDFDLDMYYLPSDFDITKNYLYGIVEIGSTDTDIIVKANPYRKTAYGIEVEDYEDETTRWFAFARKEPILRTLQDLFNRDIAWAPLMSDYRVDFVNNIREAGTNHLVVYRHRSCWENSSHYFLHRENVDRSTMDYYVDPEDDEEDVDASEFESLCERIFGNGTPAPALSVIPFPMQRNGKLYIDFETSVGLRRQGSDNTFTFADYQPRRIEIVPNINGHDAYDVEPGEGYFVTIYNLTTGRQQLGTKPMDIVGFGDGYVELRGIKTMAASPFGWFDPGNEDFAARIYHMNGEPCGFWLHRFDTSNDYFYGNGQVTPEQLCIDAGDFQ